MTGEFVELVWRNGQILMRGRSTTPPCISLSSHSPNPRLETCGSQNLNTSKRRKLGILNSLLDFEDSPLRGKELSDYEHSVQHNRHRDHLFPRSYENNLNFIMGNNNTNDDVAESQIVPDCTDENLSKLDESSFQKCHASVPISRMIADGNQPLDRFPNPNLQHLTSGPEKNLVSRKVSPGGLPKADDQHQGATVQAGCSSSLRVKQLERTVDTPVAGQKALLLLDKERGRSAEDFHNHPDLVPIKKDQIQQIANPSDESPPDEQSEAPVYKNEIRRKRFRDEVPVSNSNSSVNTENGVNPDRRKCKDQLAAGTSICSREASNDTSHSVKRKQQDEEETMSPIREICGGDQEVPKAASGRVGAKRRSQQVHNQCKRDRREKIKEKMRALQALIPNSSKRGSKMDKALLLDKTIEYLKALQLQLQMMSLLGTETCVTPMIVPTGIQYIQQATHLAQLSNMGMAMRLPMGVGNYSPAMFSNSAIVGLPFPFIPLAGGSSNSTT